MIPIHDPFPISLSLGLELQVRMLDQCQSRLYRAGNEPQYVTSKIEDFNFRPPPVTDYWMPGDSLLHSSPRFPPCDMHSSPIVSPQTSSNSEILDALKGMQEGVESKFSTIVEKLDTVCDRLVVLENWQKGMEEEIRASASSSSSASPRTPIPGKRCRRTPPALQVPYYLTIVVQHV